MGTFDGYSDGTNLFQSDNLVVPIDKDILDIRIGIELSTFIELYILVFTSRTILQKELTEPFNWRRFASLNRTPLHTCEVISYKNQAGFPIDSNTILASLRILRSDSTKCKIN